VNPDEKFARYMARALGVAVLLGWIASVGTEIATQGAYHAPAAVHGLMGIVVGATLPAAGLKRLRQKVAEKIAPDEEGHEHR
jgi:hypothetical protein